MARERWGFIKPYLLQIGVALAIAGTIIFVLLRVKSAGKMEERMRAAEQMNRAARERIKVDVQTQGKTDDEVDDMLRPPSRRGRPKATSALPFLLLCLLIAGCAAPVAPVDPCTGFRPIYLSEGAIAALRPFRTDKEKIAAHNQFWEGKCPEMGEE